MQIQYFVNSTNIEKLKHLLQAIDYGKTPISYSFDEFMTGHILILEADHGGNSLFLQDISLLEFFDSLEQFLSQHKKQPKAEKTLCDINQSYWLNVTKKGKLLTLRTTFSGQEYSVELDYTKFLSRLRGVSRSFHVDLIYFCPQTLQLNEFADSCSKLGIDLSKIKTNVM